MSKMRQILRFKTASETVGSKIEAQESASYSGYEDFLNKMISYIENILHSTEDIEKQFVKHIPSVSVTLGDLNAAIYEKKNEDLSEVAKEVFSNYNLLNKYMRLGHYLFLHF